MIKQKVITRAYKPEVVAHMNTIDDGFIRPDELAGPLKHESFYDFVDRVSEEANKLNTISISYINENTAVIVYNTKSKEELVAEMYTSTLNAMGIEPLSSEEKEEFGSYLAKQVCAKREVVERKYRRYNTAEMGFEDYTVEWESYNDFIKRIEEIESDGRKIGGYKSSTIDYISDTKAIITYYK